MDDIERQILIYDELSADERRAVDAYLEAHPEASSLLAEGRALASLLDAAARLDAEVPDAEAVAQYVAAQHMARRPLPADLAALSRRIEDAFEEHPEVERQFSIMQDRLKSLTAESESPLAQFERLTERRLGAENHLELVAEREPAAPPSPVRRDRSKGWRTSVTDHLSLLQRVSLPRLAFAATFIVVLLYGSLFLAGRAGQPQHVRLADLDAVDSEFVGLRLRGADGEYDLATDRYAEALEALDDARSSTFGLFPSYDEEGLAEAVRLLDRVTELEGSGSALGLEAWFLVGKIFLHQNEIEAARAAFQIVVQQQGPSAPDAQRLLDEIGPAVDMDE